MMLIDSPSAPQDDPSQRPTVLGQLARLTLIAFVSLNLLWFLWLWFAADRQAEEEISEHITEEIARFVHLFETQWPERRAYLMLEVHHHLGHAESLAMVITDHAGIVLASHDPQAAGRPLPETHPEFAHYYEQFRVSPSAFATWRDRLTYWGAARWSMIPSQEATGHEGIILIGYDLAPTRNALLQELLLAAVGPYLSFVAIFALLAFRLWRYHLEPLGQMSEKTATNPSAAQWRATAQSAPTHELALLAHHAAAAAERIESQQRELRLLAAAIEASPASIVITDTTPAILWVNPAFEKATGYRLDEVKGKNPSLLKSGQTPLATYQQMWAKLTAGEIWVGEFINRCKDGEIYHEMAVIAPVAIDGASPSHYVAVKFDISREKRLAAALEFVSTHDAVTQLLNRQSFLELLDDLCHQQERRYFALAHLDIGRFGYFNHRYGTACGDAILRAAAERLLAVTRTGEVVARIGSDEMALLIPWPAEAKAPQGQGRASEQEAVAERLAAILAALAEPLRLSDRQPAWPDQIAVTWTVGALPSLDRFTNGSDALAAAALALTRAKREEVPLAWFSEGDAAQLTRQGQILDALRAALTNQLQGALTLAWQPKIQQGSLVGAEALLRFTHPALGPISPAEFIPLAEESDLIVPLGQWALNTACQQAAQWAQQDAFTGTIAVNVSPKQIRNPTFAQQVAEALATSGWPGNRLVLEITENLFLDETEAVVALLSELTQRHGVEWSIDDFGTGYSSLAYLERLPVHELKIDQYFIRQLHTNPQSIRLVEAIVQIGTAFHLRIVAEGVEDAACVAALAPFPALIHQGWFYSRPVPADEFAATWLSGRGATSR